MKNNNQKIVGIVVSTVVLALAGCRFKREVVVSLPIESEEQIQTEGNTNIGKEDDSNYLESIKLKKNDHTDLNQFAQLFLQTTTIEEAEQYKPKHYLGDYYYEKDGTVAIYNKNFAISYSDENDGMASSYNRLMNPIEDGTLLRGIYPKEELDSCTKEQAVQACEKYAKLCGYEGAEVSSYAITLDAVEKINKIISIGAPGEGYEVITRGQVEQLRDEGKDSEADALAEKIDSGAERNLPWKKEYEAMLLVYQLKLNDVLVDSKNQTLKIIYVPYKDKIAVLSADIPYTVEEFSEKRELVSKEKAMSQVVQSVGTDIKINTVSLVYVIQNDQNGNENAVPAWKVEYIANVTEDTVQITNEKVIYVDAVSGFVVNN